MSKQWDFEVKLLEAQNCIQDTLTPQVNLSTKQDFLDSFIHLFTLYIAIHSFIINKYIVTP